MTGTPGARTATVRDQWRGILAVVGAIVAWGAYFPFAKRVLVVLAPIDFLVFRLGVGAAVLALLALLQRRSLRLPRHDVVGVVVAALVGIVAHQLLQLYGLRATTATNTAWMLTLIPPATGLLGWLFLGERVRGRQVGGLVVAMAGVLLLVSHGDLMGLSLGHNRGDLLALGTVATWAIYTIVTKARLKQLDPLVVSCWHMVIGFTSFALLAGPGFVQRAQALTPALWITVLVIGVVPSGLAYYWWNDGLKRLSAVDTSMYLFAEAIVTSLVSGWLLGEAFTPAMVAGAVVTFAGVLWAQRRAREPGHGRTDRAQQP